MFKIRNFPGDQYWIERDQVSTVDANNHVARFGIILILLLWGGCGDEGHIVKVRVASPNGKLDAVLVEWPTNATSGRSYGFGLVPKGQSPKDTDLHVTGAGIFHEGVKWIDDSHVQVEYRGGSSINRFSNLSWFPDEQSQPPSGLKQYWCDETDAMT
jgi:hypothetical protein